MNRVDGQVIIILRKLLFAIPMVPLFTYSKIWCVNRTCPWTHLCYNLIVCCWAYLSIGVTACGLYTWSLSPPLISSFSLLSSVDFLAVDLNAGTGAVAVLDWLDWGPSCEASSSDQPKASLDFEYTLIESTKVTCSEWVLAPTAGKEVQHVIVYIGRELPNTSHMIMVSVNHRGATPQKHPQCWAPPCSS